MRQEFSLDVRLAAAPETLREADIICTATNASAPVFSDADVKPGAHINAIGAYRPEAREIPSETVQRAKIVVDQRTACWSEAGDLIIPLHKDSSMPTAFTPSLANSFWKENRLAKAMMKSPCSSRRETPCRIWRLRHR